MLLSRPAGWRTMGIEVETLFMKKNRLPAEIADLAERLHGERREDRNDQRIATRGLELGDLPVDRSIRGFVSRFPHGTGVFVAQHIAHRSEERRVGKGGKER